jgi:Co/Zn/Cd efflux system component
MKINGIVSITKIKCWQVTQKELVASIQITCFISSVSQIQEIVGQVKAVMRKEGVGESTVEITL